MNKLVTDKMLLYTISYTCSYFKLEDVFKIFKLLIIYNFYMFKFSWKLCFM